MNDQQKHPLKSEREMTPNDLKLSDRGARRTTCVVCGKAEAEAGSVTCGTVRCSAWLGVAVISVLAGAYHL